MSSMRGTMWRLRDWPWAMLLVFLMLPMVGIGAEEEPEPLRNWLLSVQYVSAERLSYDVFGHPDFVPDVASEPGHGGGFSFGYRFGDRFVLAAQFAQYNLTTNTPDTSVGDLEFLLTGTVLFYERSMFQPFIRGGLGGTGVGMSDKDDRLDLSIGTAAVIGGGVQVRLARWFSLEFEAVATFANYLVRMEDVGGDNNLDWSIRRSGTGWRTGIGLVFWL